jgi:disulfide bond formation protein DsbB
MRMPSLQLVRCYVSMGLSLISVGLGVAQYAVHSMQTAIQAQPSTKQSSGSTVTFVGFMTTPSDSSE